MDERTLYFRTTINTTAATPNNPATAPNTMPTMADGCKPEVTPGEQRSKLMALIFKHVTKNLMITMVATQ